MQEDTVHKVHKFATYGVKITFQKSTVFKVQSALHTHNVARNVRCNLKKIH